MRAQSRASALLAIAAGLQAGAAGRPPVFSTSFDLSPRKIPHVKVKRSPTDDDLARMRKADDKRARKNEKRRILMQFNGDSK